MSIVRRRSKKVNEKKNADWDIKLFQPKKKAGVEVTVNSAEEVTASFSIGTTVQLSSFADP